MPSTMLPERLSRAFRDHSACLGVIGLGYVGLPLSIAAARAGFHVIGFDINESRCEGLNRGETFIRHIPATDIAEVIAARRFEATPDFARLRLYRQFTSRGFARAAKTGVRHEHIA